MSKSFRSPGKVMDFVTGADQLSGDVVAIGGGFGVLSNDTKSGLVGSLALEGVFKLPKATGAWVQGDQIFWDGSAKKCTKTKTGNTQIGLAWQAQGSADALGEVLLSDQSDYKAAVIAAIATADGSDAASTQALANSTKVTVNAILVALKNAGLMVS
jgi:predicted RecA/RadA family phage recombinase